LITAAVSRVWGFEQSTTGVSSTHTSGPRFFAGAFRHCPTSAGGGTSAVVDERVEEGAEDEGVGRAGAAELVLFPQAVQPTTTTTPTTSAAARWSVVMSLPFRLCEAPPSTALVQQLQPPRHRRTEPPFIPG